MGSCGFLQVWQHCDCMGVNSDVEHYLCEQCEPRSVNRVQKRASSVLFLPSKATFACIYIAIGVGFSLSSVASWL